MAALSAAMAEQVTAQTPEIPLAPKQAVAAEEASTHQCAEREARPNSSMLIVTAGVSAPVCAHTLAH
eukprot:5307219-Pleurochrysis_carterae.AAC.1